MARLILSRSSRIFERLHHIKGAQVVTPGAMSGKVGGVPWSIQVGSILNIDIGASQEYVFVSAVTGTTFTATFAKSHGSAPVQILGNVYNQQRDASGENDGASVPGTAVVAECEYNAGDPSRGNFDRARSRNAKGVYNSDDIGRQHPEFDELNGYPNIGLQAGMKVLLQVLYIPGRRFP